MAMNELVEELQRAKRARGSVVEEVIERAPPGVVPERAPPCYRAGANRV
jgi:hypothetical protein